MKEYVEREALMDEIHRIGGHNLCEWDTIGVKALVCRQPAADVVEVVRCKDCVHFQPYDGEEHKGDCAELVGLESCVYEEDFCSYGERKMDGGKGNEP